MSLDYGAPFFEKGTVKFKNGASEAAPAHAVMEITASERDSTTGEIIYTIGKPSATFRRLYLVNGVMEVAADGYGEGTFLHSGGAVLYNSGDGTPAVDESWGAKASQWSLAKNRPGFLITAANNTSATAPYTSAVQSEVVNLKGKPDTTITANSATGQAVSIYMGVPGSLADTSINVTAYALGTDCASAKWCVLTWMDNYWWAFPAEC